MIDSESRKMSRIVLFHTCFSNALSTLQDQKKAIPENLTHYLEGCDRNTMTYNDKGYSSDKLNILGADAIQTHNLADETRLDSEEFINLKRVIDYQLLLTEDRKFESVKEGNQLNSQALKNPSNLEASFRAKAGEKHVDYVRNFTETVDDETGLAIIDSADLQPNIHSDSKFCKAKIEKMTEEGGHSVLVADGAYGLDKIFTMAIENAIELVTTALTGKDTTDLSADFKIVKE